MRTKESQRKINSLILLLLCTATLLITSTYAWFTAQKNVTVTNLQGKVNVTDSLAISIDGNDWKQSIDFDSITRNAYASSGSATAVAKNVKPTELLPASYTGEVTSNLTKMPLYSIKYDSNGKITEVTDVSQYETSDTDYATKCGYIAFDLFFKDTTPPNSSGTTPSTTTLKLNIDASAGLLKNSSNQTVATAGTENAIRVAFCKYDSSVSYGADQTTILNALKYGGSAKIEKIAIWEPNSTNHVYSIWKNNNTVKKTNATTITQFAINEAMTTFALKAAGTTTGSDNAANYRRTVNSQSVDIDIYDWSGTNSSVMAAQNTTQTTHADGTYVITTTNSTPVTLKDTSNDDFTIPTNSVTKIRVYVWLEGQDVDCTDLASGGLGIDINLSLTK